MQRGRRRVQAARFAGAVALAIALAGGCGPIEYVNQVTRKAATEVEAARAMDAAKHSPYWFTRAEQYLIGAREKAASADYQAATRFGRLSEEAAIKAQEETRERVADGDGAGAGVESPAVDEAESSGPVDISDEDAAREAAEESEGDSGFADPAEEAPPLGDTP